MTPDPLDPRLDTDTRNIRGERSTGMVWGTLAVLAMLIIGGLIWYGTSNRTNQTASVNTPATQSAPITTGGPGQTTNPPATPR